jgi:adenine-specific DNA-methyltransferase
MKIEPNDEGLAELETIRRRLAELESSQRLGLVWRDIPEDVETRLRDEVPVFVHEKELDVPGASPSDSPHILIEGDNLHALHVLQATHKGRVDVIYIDPPYNTGNQDWIYNDRYVDKEDGFRHSKWLSFIHKRINLARSLLSENGTMVISIGRDEIHRLALLCEQVFPDRQVHTVTIKTSGGKPSGGFNYVHEHLIFVVPHDFKPSQTNFTGGNMRTAWEGMTLATFTKVQRPNQVYPIFVNSKTGALHSVGKSLDERIKAGTFKGKPAAFRYEVDDVPRGCVAIWPITAKGDECVWRLIPARLTKDWQAGYVKITPNVRKDHPNKFSIQYLPAGVIKKVLSGEIPTHGTEPGVPTLSLGVAQTSGADIPTMWAEQSHHTTNGTDLIKQIFGSKAFQYPKPLQLIIDIITATSSAKDDAVILDFFAGSGTTLHAVASMNEEDGGHRQCILVTNNENDICRSITIPRAKAILTGKWAGGKHDPLPGSLVFFHTDFVKRSKSPDRMRTEIARHTVDLVAVKESTARTVSRTAALAVLKGAAKTVAVVPGLDPDHAELRKVAEKKVEDGDKKIVYLFTWSDHGVEEEVAALWPGWEVNPLPAEMLAALRRLAPPARLFDDLGGVS